MSNIMKVLRKQLKWLLPVLAVFLAGALIISRVIQPEMDPQPLVSISPGEAIDHVEKYAEVCGMVTQATEMPQIGGSPVFLNFGGIHPNQDFTVVIWQRFHDRWPQPPQHIFDAQSVCVEGEIELHQGTPQIEVSRPDHIRILQL